MAWPSLFRRKPPAEPSPHPAARQAARGRAGTAESNVPDVEQARTRARRRLIGATVLLGIGIIAFPLLFETEPRPIPVDLPIEIPRPDAVPPLALPSASSGVSSGTVAEPAGVAPTPAPVAAAPAPAAEPAAAQGAAPKEVPKEATPEPPRAANPAPTPAPAPDGARAQALLEGRPAAGAQTAPALDPAPTAASVATRFVVQVGAFADDSAARAVRARVERLGLRTYTQVVKVDAGDRTRVRIGPFDDRAKADDVADRLKQAGLPAVVLRL